MQDRLGRRREPSFDDFRRRIRGDDGDHLAVPSEDARYFPGTPVRAIGVELVQRDGLFLPASVARQPQPIDLVGAYLTFEEIFGRRAGLAYVREALGLIGRDPFIRSCAELLGQYEAPDADRRQVDEALIKATFREPARGRVQGLLRSGNRALITPQSLLLLIQLALLHSPATPTGATEPKPFIAVVLALQDGLGHRDGDGGARSDDDTRIVFRGESHSPLFRAIIANQAFAKWPDARILIARAHCRGVRVCHSPSVVCALAFVHPSELVDQTRSALNQRDRRGGPLPEPLSILSHVSHTSLGSTA